MDIGKFIPTDVRRTGHDMGMTPENVYCAHIIAVTSSGLWRRRSRPKLGLPGFCPWRIQTPFSIRATSPLANPGDLHQGKGGGGVGCAGAVDGPDHSRGKHLAEWSRPLGGEASGKIGPVLPLDLESETESELGKRKKRMEGEAAVFWILTSRMPSPISLSPRSQRSTKPEIRISRSFP